MGCAGDCCFRKARVVSRLALRADAACRRTPEGLLLLCRERVLRAEAAGERKAGVRLAWAGHDGPFRKRGAAEGEQIEFG